MFRYITFSEEERNDRTWQHQQQFQPQLALPASQPLPPLYDTNGFFNVRGSQTPAPLADSAALTPRQPATPSTETVKVGQATTPLQRTETNIEQANPRGTASLGGDTKAASVKREGQPAENPKRKASKAAAKPAAAAVRPLAAVKPEASPDASDKKQFQAVEAAMQRSINRVLAAQAQANEIKRLVESDADWKWMNGTPAIEDFLLKRVEFEKFMMSSNFMKSLLLSAGDMGPFHCKGVLVIPWPYPLGIPSHLPADYCERVERLGGFLQRLWSAVSFC